MPLYRKKPVVIEAHLAFMLIELAKTNWQALPDWIKSAYEAGGIVFGDNDLSITTPEGVMKAGRQDWVIRGVKGEIYPCKSDIFEATYEPVL